MGGTGVGGGAGVEGGGSAGVPVGGPVIIGGGFEGSLSPGLVNGFSGGATEAGAIQSALAGPINGETPYGWTSDPAGNDRPVGLSPFSDRSLDNPVLNPVEDMRDVDLDRMLDGVTINTAPTVHSPVTPVQEQWEDKVDILPGMTSIGGRDLSHFDPVPQSTLEPRW